MIFRPHCAPSAFRLSLVLALLVLLAESFVLRHTPVAAVVRQNSQATITSTTSASGTEQRRLAARRRVRFEQDEPLEPGAQAEAYERALRQACVLPRTELGWRSLGPRRALPLIDFCRAEANELAQWRATWLATLGRSSVPDNPLFLNGAVVAGNAAPVWWASAGAQGIWRGTPAGWQKVSSAATDLIAVNEQAIYAVRNGWQLDKSSDGGATFVTVTPQLAEADDAQRLPVAPLALSDNQLWTGGRALWRSLDGGAHWVAVGAAIMGSGDNRVSAVAVAAPRAGEVQPVLAGSSEGWIQRFVMSAATAQHDAALPRRGFVSALVFDPHDERTVYASYTTFGGAHLWQSRDSGVTWRALDGVGAAALPDLPVNTLALDPRVAGRLFVGTDAGVFMTTDNGASWSLVLPGVWVTGLQFVPEQNGRQQLYVFANDGNGAGLWVAPLEQLDAGNKDKQQTQQPSCVYGLIPAALIADGAGENKTIEVQALAECNWVAQPEASAEGWITISGATSGKGNGRVSIHVAPNGASALLFGTLNIGGRTCVIAQYGVENSCKTQPITPGEPALGQLGEGDCLLNVSGQSFYYADQFSFSARAGELVAVLAQSLTNNAQAETRLLAPDGQPVGILQPHVTEQPLAVLPLTGTYTLQVFGNSPQQSLGYRVVLQLLPPGCDSFMVTALDRNFEAAGGPGRLVVSTASNCAWQAISSAPWLRLAEVRGSGSQRINFTVAENSSAALRTAYLEVGGKRASITQAGNGSNCAPQLIAPNQTVSGMVTAGDCPLPSEFYGSADRYLFSGRAGQRVSVEIKTLQPSSSRVYIFSARGDSLAQVSELLPQAKIVHFSLPEDGGYSIAVSTFSFPLIYTLTLYVQPAECSYVVAPERVTVGGSGGSVTVQLQTQPHCPWQLLPAAYSEWLPVEAGLQGLGSRSITLRVPANQQPHRRAATFSFGEQYFEIIQAGASGNCEPVAVTLGQPVQGQLNSGDCPSQFLQPPLNGLFAEASADRFTFDGTAGQVFSFTPFVPGFNGAALEIIAPVGYALLDPQGNLIAAGQTDPQLPLPSFILPKTGAYLFELVGSQRNSQFNYVLMINLSPVGCTTNATISATRFEAAGGNGSLQIDAPPGCRWLVQAQVGVRQFSFTDRTDGSGRGQVRFTFGPNTTGTAGLVLLRIGQQSFYLAQAGINGACLARALPYDQFVSGQITPADCPLTDTRPNVAPIYPQGDRYTFLGTAGEQIALTAIRQVQPETGASFLPSVKIYGPDGDLLNDGLTARLLGGRYLLSQTGSYTVEVTLPDNSYYGYTEYQILLERLTPGCLYTASAGLQRFDGVGGQGAFSLTTGSQCRWTPRASASWLRLENPPDNASWQGSVAGSFTVDGTTLARARSAAIVVAGQAIEVEQAGEGGKCAVAPLMPNRPVEGTLTPGDCRARLVNGAGVADFYQFTARLNDRFRLRANSTPTHVPVSYTVFDSAWRVVASLGNLYGTPSNNFTLPPDTYFLQVSGAATTAASPAYTLTLELSAGQCQYTILQNEPYFFSAPSTGTLTVLAGNDCAWTARSGTEHNSGNWLSIVSGSSGSGNGTVTFLLQPFELIQGSRTGWIEVAQQRFTITQLSARPPENCEPVQLGFDRAYQGMLAPFDCVSQFLPLFQSSRADRFAFTSRAGQQFAIEVTSNHWLTMTLYDAAQRVIAQGSGGRIPLGHAPPHPYMVLPDNQTYFLELAVTNSTTAFNYTLRLITPSSCAYTLSQTTPAQNQPLPAAGGNGVIQVSAPPGCAWNAHGDNMLPPWLTLTGAAAGTGPGTIEFSVAPNETENFRLAGVPNGANLPSIAISQLGKGGVCSTRQITAGEIVRGTLKAADCPHSLRFPNGLTWPGSRYHTPVHRFSFTAARGDQLAVQARRFSTAWDSGLGQFMLFDPRGQAVIANGGTLPAVPLTLLASGTYTLEYFGLLGDYEFVLDLTPGHCGFVLESEQAQFSGSGGSGTINVLAQSECSWTAYSTDPWITLAKSSGKGNGTVSFTIAPNTGTPQTQTRFGAIQISGRALPIVQAGHEGSCAPLPITAGQTVAGELTPRDCLRLDANNRATMQPVDRYSFTARAGEQALVKVVSNGALGVQIVPASALRLSSTAPGTYVPGQPNDWFGTASLTIPADGTYIIEVMPGGAIQQTIPYTLHLQVNAPGCGVILNEAGRQFANTATQASFTATVPAGCRWQVYAVHDWITINGGRERTGAGSVGFAITANPEAAARWGAIIAGGQIYVIEQAGTGGINGTIGTCATGSIAVGQTVFGQLSAADCRPTAEAAGLVVADRYAFSGTAGQRVQFVARMSEPSLPTLRLLDNSGSLITQFTATGSAPPLHARIPESGDFFSLPRDGSYIIEIALHEATNRPLASDYSLSFTSAPPGCGYSVSAQPLRFNAAGGSSTVNVVTTNNCTWTATTTDAWVKSQPPALQTGSGTVTFTVESNPGNQGRRSLLLVGGNICVIEQAGSTGNCVARLLVPGQTLTGTLDEQDCPSLTLPQEDRPNSGLQLYAERYAFSAQSGDRMLFTLAANYGTANQQASVQLRLLGPNGVQLLTSTNGRLPAFNDRAVLPLSGTYEIEISANQKLSYVLTLLLGSGECQLNLSPRQWQFEATGGSGALNITALATCQWQAYSNAPWLRFDNQTNRAGGAGNTTLNFSLAANPTAQARATTIAVGDNLITVEQAGSESNCAPRSLMRNQAINGKWDDGDCSARLSPIPLPYGGVSQTVTYADRYTFNATAGERISLTLQTTVLYPRLELYDAQLRLVVAVTGKRLPSGAGEFILPVTGTYTLLVLANEVATYSLLATDSNTCSFTITPNPLVAPGSGGKREIQVMASQPGCAWTARSATNWISLPNSGAPGIATTQDAQIFSGTHTLAVTLAANLGAARTGFLWIADRLITVQQEVRQLIPVAEPLVCVNAATFTTGTLAPDVLVTAFGRHLATATQVSPGWAINVADTTVTVTDHLQVKRDAYVLFVSPTQVNFVIPNGTVPGPVTVAVTSADGYVTSCTLTLAPVAPGLFSASASGSGLASGVILRVKANGAQHYEPLAQFDRALNRFIALPVTVNAPGESVYLILYGTGMRWRSELTAITARIGTTQLTASYCGAVGHLLGLDQLNLALPATLAGRGNVQVELAIDGQAANPVWLNVK